jgi:hypothetical protein
MAATTLVLTSAACGGAPTIPADAQRIRVTTADELVTLVPETASAGTVFFEFTPDPATQDVEVTLVHRILPGDNPDPDAPDPLREAEVEQLRRGDEVPGLGVQSGFGSVAELTLAPGFYLFHTGSGLPGEQFVVLEVTP